MDLTFDEVFKLPLFCLKLTRAHPDIPKGIKWFLVFLVIYGVYFLYFFILIYNITVYNLKAHDFAQTCKNGTFSTMVLACFLVYTTMVWKKEFLTSLFKTVKMDYIKAKKLSIKEQEIVLKYAKQCKWVGKMWSKIVLCGVLSFPVKNIILHTYYYFIGDFHWIHLYDLIFPEVINERKDQKLVFCILYAIMIFYILYCAAVFSSFIPLGPNFMLHACGQLEILTKRVETFFVEDTSVQDVMNEIKSVSIELQKIYDFVEVIKDTFKIAYELLLKVSSIIFPVTAYGVIEAFAKGDLCVEFVIFIIGSAILASSPCYYGELLQEKQVITVAARCLIILKLIILMSSCYPPYTIFFYNHSEFKGETFRLAVYSCGWERTYDRHTRTMVLMLLLRAGRPIAIQTIFRTLCLDTLADASRQSYAIFNLMNAMWK